MNNKPLHNKVGIFFLLLVFSFIGTSCKQDTAQNQKRIVAQVYDHVLYWDEVKDFVPDNVGKEDSAQIMSGLISKWVVHQLKLQKAEQNLEPGQKDLSKELEDYRSSLLIYKYEQEYIKQKLDTVITAKDIKTYYEEFKPQLKLEKPVVKCAYVILPLDAPQYYAFRNMFRNQFEDKQDEISAWCQENAEVYFHSDDNFIYFEELQKKLPIETENPENILKYNRFVELKDVGFKYLVIIFDYKLKSDIAPLNIVENEIRSILLNKRKIKLIQKLEESIMNEAVNHNQIEIKK